MTGNLICSSRIPLRSVAHVQGTQLLRRDGMTGWAGASRARRVLARGAVLEAQLHQLRTGLGTSRAPRRFEAFLGVRHVAVPDVQIG